MPQELEAHYSRAPSFLSIGSHSLSQGCIQLDTSDATAAARAGGARELPAPPPNSLRRPPGLRLPAGVAPAAGGLAGSSMEGVGPAAYGGHECSPFAPDGPAAFGSPNQPSPFASGQLPFESDEGQAAQHQGQAPAQEQVAQHAAAPPVAPAAAGLHPAASITNESPFASLPPFGDSDEEEAAPVPRLVAIPEARSGGLSSVPTGSSACVSAGSVPEASLTERLQLCGLAGSEMGGSVEDPLQVCCAVLCCAVLCCAVLGQAVLGAGLPSNTASRGWSRRACRPRIGSWLFVSTPWQQAPPLPPRRPAAQADFLSSGPLTRAMTLHQHLEEAAAARPALPAARLVRQRSARELSPSAKAAAADAGAGGGGGSGPASAAAVGTAASECGTLRSASSPFHPPSFPSVTEAAAWCSLDNSGL